VALHANAALAFNVASDNWIAYAQGTQDVDITQDN
jgi:hypothetical protein